MTPRSFRVWLSACAACIFLARGRDAAAQSSHPHPDSLSTRSGVYTTEQAMRGREIYAGNCKSCHTVESHTGAAFNATWNGRSLAELYTYIAERMPKNSPGALEPQEYADVLAYVLRINRLPPGSAELPADAETLKAVRIDIPKFP